jgi:hypothetical protein
MMANVISENYSLIPWKTFFFLGGAASLVQVPSGSICRRRVFPSPEVRKASREKHPRRVATLPLEH